jgi:hypothetical protein
MDKHTIFTIVITVALTTAVTTIVNWTLMLAKVEMANRLTKVANTTLLKRIARFALYLLMTLGSIWSLVVRLRASGPPTRIDVLWIVIDFSAIVSWILILIGFLIGVQVEKKFREHNLDSAEQLRQ